MYCLTDMCYVCLEKKDKSLININSSMFMNEDIIHIIGYVPINLAWLKTKRLILICEECCRRLRETHQFLAMCLKNSAVLQGYMAQLNTADNEAELRVHLNTKPDGIQSIKCEIKQEETEIYTFEREPITQEHEDVFVNVHMSVVDEEDTWKSEQVDDKEELPMDNNYTASSDNESETEMAVNRNTHDTDTDSDSSEATSTQGHTTNKKEPNTPATKSHNCKICSKCFTSKLALQIHTRAHTGEKPYKCTTCDKCFTSSSNLLRHIQTHTGEKPFKCTRCNKCVRSNASLMAHMRLHTGERPYECSECKKSFVQKPHLVTHMRTHSGEKPYKCSRCKRCFAHQSALAHHMRLHTGEKPYQCTSCRKCFTLQFGLVRHMLTHTGEKPYECSRCKKSFNLQSNLVRHMRTHTGE